MATMLDEGQAAREGETAELRRRLAEREAELAEARAQQAATAEILQVINASPGDLTPVFDAILEKAHNLCGVAYGSLQMYDGGKFRAAAVHALPEPLADWLRLGHRPSEDFCRRLGEEGFVHITDLAELAVPSAQSVVELGGVRTTLHIALRRDNRLLGQIVAARQEVRPFTDKQIALLQNFAAQAVIAMENARLLTETREALEQQTATAEILQVINSSPGNLQPVLDSILDKALRLCEAQIGTLWTYEGDEATPVAFLGAPPEFAEFLQRGNLSPQPPRSDKVIHILDLKDSKEYLAGYQITRAAVDLGHVRTMLIVPLRKDEAVLGRFSIYRQEVRAFSGKQIALLQNFAAQAVIAMENARLLGELRARTDEIAALNRELEARVAAQLGELERMGRLKRFLAPQLAEMIVAKGEEHILENHRRDIVVVFCDLRGFTTFAETAEPEEVLDFLREYHAALGPIVMRSEGTLNQFTGDGLMVLFNDPLPCPDAPERAVGMALQMREAAAGLQARWRRHGRRIGFGVGIAQGYATLGQVGFAERVDYTAMGTVCNLAARLCAEAQDGQILISGRIAAAVEDKVRLEEIGDLALKGLSQAVAVYNVVGV